METTETNKENTPTPTGMSKIKPKKNTSLVYLQYADIRYRTIAWAVAVTSLRVNVRMVSYE